MRKFPIKLLDRLKQYLCKHDFKLISKNKIVSENLYQCGKCNIYMLNHTGLGIYIETTKLPSNIGWEFKK